MSFENKESTVSETQFGSLLPDIGNQVPDLTPYLRQGEKVVRVKPCPTPAFAKLPDYQKELCRLCRVNAPTDIGKNGPAIAASALKQTAEQGLFACRFGRDGLYAAMDLLPEFPMLTRTTLLDYASLIGMTEHAHREEEFGRMFHEARAEDDPIAQELSRQWGWDWPFYGAVDATPLFVKVLYDYVTAAPENSAFLRELYQGRDGNTHTMADALRFSVSWIVGRVNRNPQRFLEYRPAFPGSHINQVMEDSYDSHFHADGTLANTRRGVCSAEVQGLAYDALLIGAELGEMCGTAPVEASYWRLLAAQLQESIFRYLLVQDERGTYFGVGTDRNEQGLPRTLKVLKAMPFTLLDSLLFESQAVRQYLPEIVRTLFHPSLICPAGIRSLAAGEPRFMPGAYHNGTSWPMQTFRIAEGLRRQGYHILAAEFDHRLVTAVEHSKTYPEHFNGNEAGQIRLNERIVETYDALDGRTNQREHPPQQIQLWTLSAYAAIQHRQKTNISKLTPKPFEEGVLENL